MTGTTTNKICTLCDKDKGSNNECQFCGMGSDKRIESESLFDKVMDNHQIKAILSHGEMDKLVSKSATTQILDAAFRSSVAPEFTSLHDEPKEITKTMKVTITTICSVVPMLGQVTGVILSMIYLTRQSVDDKTFGKALLISSLCLIVVWLTVILFMFANIMGK